MKLVATIPAANPAEACHQLVRRSGVQRRDVHHRRDRTGRTKAGPPVRHAMITRPTTATRANRASEMATATRFQRPTTTGTISVAIAISLALLALVAVVGRVIIAWRTGG